MMASQHTKVHDPMYNFDTHFPDRLSRLHLHGDPSTSGSFRKKKGRNQRNAARYKTQPVTFDEIKEVDEEPSQGSAKGSSKGSANTGSSAAAIHEAKATSAEHVLGQLQAFSRSMDGLVPKSAVYPADHLHFHGSHSRSGSRKFQRHPDCIPEKSENEPTSPEAAAPPSNPSGGAPSGSPSVKGGKPQEASSGTADPSGASGHPLAAAAGVSSVPSSSAMAPRRQKITAKAKKRQKAQSESDV